MLVPKKRNVRIKTSDMSLKDFYQKRNKVLIIRDTGGIGDILMLRMMVEDFKLLMPEAEITVATLINYHHLLKDHPFIDKIANSREINENDYIISYNITSACIRYESKIAPRSDLHRSDIWAAHCGMILTKHNMHLTVTPEMKEYALNLINSTKPAVAFCPISTMPSKDLDEKQIADVVKGVQEMGYNVFIIHHKDLPNLPCQQIRGSSLLQWLALVDEMDYVITVDTGHFHAAQGLDKPTVGIFTWADGKVYGKYHPKMILVQKHRDDTPGWSCGPCYNYRACSQCPLTEVRKPCVTEISGKEICEAFTKLRQLYPIKQCLEENIPLLSSAT